MNTSKDFQSFSYEQHQKNFDKYKAGESDEQLAKTWLTQHTVNTWRHERMYNLLDPILETDPGGSWVTVGDGRYGTDAKYILDKGCKALATDISDSLLKEAKEMGFIPEYKEENAESLSFSDSEFDYAFCKEAYHHFPRPMIALYEMLRVVRKAVVLIEPSDPYVFTSLPHLLYTKVKDAIKSFLGKEPMHFEVTGNFIYSISRREMEKVATGLSYHTIAVSGVNDYYAKGVEYEALDQQGALYKKTKRMIALYDISQKLKLKPFALLCTILFKEKPSETLLQKLTESGYEVIRLPQNPYLEESA